MNRRADGLVAGVQALLWAAPIIVLLTGGHGVPAPGSINDPARALAAIRASPDIAIVTTVMCATGAAQVLVILTLADRLTGIPVRLARISTGFGMIAAAFLMIDGAIGMAALPRLAQLGARPDLAGAAYLATVGVRNGIDRVIALALGIWALTANGAALRPRRLPRPLAVLGILVGVAGIAGAVVPAAGTAAIVLLPMWTFGFAVLLLTGRSPRTASVRRSGAVQAGDPGPAVPRVRRRGSGGPG